LFELNQILQVDDVEVVVLGHVDGAGYHILVVVEVGEV
jgi:hypothetical protein